MKKAIAYYRVSTARQGRSGLGLEAQQQAVEAFAKANDFILVNDFIDINSGRRNDRPALKAALKECRKEDATLIIATLDRLSRSVAFIATLMEAHADFKVVNNPYADRFTIHILAAVAQKAREDISRNTSAALQAAKLHGVQLGWYGKYVTSKINQFHAEMFACRMKPIIDKIKARGIKTIRAIANELNRMRVPTYYKEGHRWHIRTIQNLLKRFHS